LQISQQNSTVLLVLKWVRNHFLLLRLLGLDHSTQREPELISQLFGYTNEILLADFIQIEPRVLIILVLINQVLVLL
jgi:hypothetical protein